MTLIGENRGNKENCVANTQSSRKDIGHFEGLDPRRNGAEPMSTNLMENGEKTAEGMMLNFAESGHPVFRARSGLERGELKSKGKGCE